ncbi:hypothetical protein [Thalassobius sp. Cn5-15]|uniref:hypothetical protein n=1 Tax=Thalassobius sp. Cn5-15 TaxID=2917763 RepID=UPI001EF24C81|nr:hypothetical protein [Thalassobius sp. Cn5-15]MCG7495123.1 hypothetical protein [Thalassobius sp. Cn5-15]
MIKYPQFFIFFFLSAIAFTKRFLMSGLMVGKRHNKQRLQGCARHGDIRNRRTFPDDFTPFYFTKATRGVAFLRKSAAIRLQRGVTRVLV